MEWKYESKPKQFQNQQKTENQVNARYIQEQN